MCVFSFIWMVNLLVLVLFVPDGFTTIEILPGESREFHYEFDKIYSGYYKIEISEGDSYSIEIREYERYPETAVKVTESLFKFDILEWKIKDDITWYSINKDILHNFFEEMFYNKKKKEQKYNYLLK